MRQLGRLNYYICGQQQGTSQRCLRCSAAGTTGGTANFATDGVWNGSCPNMLGCLKPYIGNSLKIFTCPDYYLAEYRFR